MVYWKQMQAGLSCMCDTSKTYVVNEYGYSLFTHTATALLFLQTLNYI